MNKAKLQVLSKKHEQLKFTLKDLTKEVLESIQFSLIPLRVL